MSLLGECDSALILPAARRGELLHQKRQQSSGGAEGRAVNLCLWEPLTQSPKKRTLTQATGCPQLTEQFPGAHVMTPPAALHSAPSHPGPRSDLHNAQTVEVTVTRAAAVPIAKQGKAPHRLGSRNTHGPRLGQETEAPSRDLVCEDAGLESGVAGVRTWPCLMPKFVRPKAATFSSLLGLR